VDVSNTGSLPGAETVQIYVGQTKCSVERPVRELKAFSKAHLAPGETQRLEMQLDARAFAFWDTAKNGWTVEAGEFLIEAGVSARDVRCQQLIQIPALAVK
jgi:beta-glucosidase